MGAAEQPSCDPLIDEVVATVKENIKTDLVAQGLNQTSRSTCSTVVTTRTRSATRTCRVSIVGGTIDQSGVDTIGIAQSIDPGNYGHEETALVLLDVVSDPDTDDDASFNAYIDAGSDRIKFIGTALGNIVSHETGHFVGSFHVDQFNDVLNLMDQGGNFPLLYGVGDDGIGGTADDPDVDFGVDTYNPNEGFHGPGEHPQQHGLGVPAWPVTPTESSGRPLRVRPKRSAGPSPA